MLTDPHPIGEAEESRIIEEKLVQIANILGISMHDQLGDLRSFIYNMLQKERDQYVEINKSKKKTRVQRELDKLACSFNYERKQGEAVVEV